MNAVYRKTPRGIRLTEEGKAFKNRCTSVMRELLLRVRRMRALPPNVGWRLMVVFWLPRLETAQWLLSGKGGRFTRRDVDNLESLTLDAVFDAIGENDASIIGISTNKKDGHGEGRLDFMLMEEAVPLEEPNATELSDEVNSRGGAIRTSPTDPPALLYHLKAHAPDSGEYRYTHFDAWRLHIMDTVLAKFDALQGALSCPARSGKIDACFECTDFMVVYCLMNNPIALNSAGVRTGHFDLCKQRVGTHVSLVDRPQGGERMESQQQMTQKTPNAHFLEVLGLLGRVEQDTRLLSNATTAIFSMLSAPDVKKDDILAQEACARLAVVMCGLIEAGAGKPLPRSVIYYRDVTTASMPDDIRDRMNKAGGAYKLCAQLYGAYRKLFIAWQKGQPAEETPAQEATTAQEPAAEAQEAPAPPEKRTRRTKKEMEQAAAESTPPVTEDASLDVQIDEDVPQTHDIPPDETAAEDMAAEDPAADDVAAASEVEEETAAQDETPAEAVEATEAVGALESAVSPEPVEGLDPILQAYIDQKFALLEKNVTAIILGQLKRLEAIAPAFNELRKWIVAQVKKG